MFRFTSLFAVVLALVLFGSVGPSSATHGGCTVTDGCSNGEPDTLTVMGVGGCFDLRSAEGREMVEDARMACSLAVSGSISSP